MKKYNIYVYRDDKFVKLGSELDQFRVSYYLLSKANKFRFICVQTVAHNNSRYEEGHVFSNSLYLSGHCLKRYHRNIDSTDVNKWKKKLTTFYSVTGEIRYYPPMPLTIQDLKEIFNLGEQDWYTMTHKFKNNNKQKYYLLFYDWSQKVLTKPKVPNKKAEERFKRELYGDVLYINENFVS